MLENQKIRPAQVIGPLGEPLTLDSLPPPSTTRWVVRRKAGPFSLGRSWLPLRRLDKSVTMPEHIGASCVCDARRRLA